MPRRARVAPKRRPLDDDPPRPEIRLGPSGVPDPGEFEGLVRRYQGLIFQHVHQMVRDYHLTQDLSQEIFLKVFRRLSSYDPRYVFSTWLLRVAHNHVLDHWKKRRVKTVSIEQPIRAGETTLAESLPQRRPTPGEVVERRDGRRRIRAAIYDLPLEQRGVLILRFLEGRKIDEIAYILDLPPGTVKSRLHRARLELQGRLDRSRRRAEAGRG